uniref:Peroxisomal membrane protein PMP34-like n=2 Tax=Hirondellea gigas TaxID=1518452 RepID=A0A2P2I3S3_9CRUS
MSSGGSGLFSYGSLVHAISGGCGSAVSMTTLYPLDIIRTRLQLQQKKPARVPLQEHDKDGVLAMLQHILETEGSSGLYRGLVPVVQSLYCSNFVYFYSFHGLKRAFNPNKAVLKDLLCGMVAGIINVMTTTPLWVVNTRLKMQGVALQHQQQPHQHYNGMIDGLMKVYKLEGIGGLWAGCNSSLLLVVNPAIQFMVYEALKRYWALQSGGADPSGLMVFMIAAASKTVATVVTYPLQLAQARQRHGGSTKCNRGLLHLFQAILRADGPTGLFRGLRAKLLQTVLTAALMFLCYEKIAAFVFALLLPSHSTSSRKM